ncbi:MAG: Uma2 family endonuclease [Bacteroidota bacterium]|uniref:Uma2 family endonuclease n=1 Tax=Runella sp. TaxID=1960881 RepID=UPI003017F2D5
MKNAAKLLDQLMEAPNLPLLAEQVNARLLEEKKRRQAFWEWVTPGIKAEFINGEIKLHSPVTRGHLRVSANLFKLLDIYIVIKDLGETSYDKGMISLTRNDYEPDICFWNKEKSAHFTDETMLHPAPDFVVEVLSKKTAKTDRTTKYQDYAAHGIDEYWIIDPKNQIVEQYWLQTIPVQEYALVAKWRIGDQIDARAVPGFSIPVAAIFDKAICAEVLKALFSSGK